MQTVHHGSRTLILLFLSLLLLGLVLHGCRSAPTPTPARPSPTAQAVGMATATPLPFGQPTPTATFPPCGTPPAGWQTYLVQPGDTLVRIAEQAGIDVTMLVRANCLTSADLAIGQRLYVPAPKPCDPPPAGWFAYIIQPGDTLFDLAMRAGVSVAEVQAVNCLRTTDLIAGERIYLPPLPEPTPTPCVAAPPGSWTRYTVEAGDTLFALALARETTVDGIMRANCLTSSVIVVGQDIFLPPSAVVVPPPPAAVVPPPPAAAVPRATPPAPQLPAPLVLRPPTARAPVSPGGSTGAPASPGGQSAAPSTCSGLDCPVITALPTISLPPGGPNSSMLAPCATPRATPPGAPWISVETELLPTPTNPSPANTQHDRVLGQRTYYFACGFPDRSKLEARMTGPTGTTSLTALSSLPNPTLKMGQAQGAWVWNATCDLPTGAYALTVDDGKGRQAQLSFNLKNTTRERILTVPQSAEVGQAFNLYFCGYDQQAGQDVVLDLYRMIDRKPDGTPNFGPIYTWAVRINASGWATDTLRSSTGYQAAPYALVDREKQLKGWDLFWLTK